MISFESDYNNGAHPAVLRHLLQTNDEQTLTYGFDVYTEQAKEKIRTACGDAEADVYWWVGGTQTNTTVIDGMQASYDAVICAETGHIAVHECGAIERSGHKVIIVCLFQQLLITCYLYQVSKGIKVFKHISGLLR